tara:strand:- start:4704 stop:5099 length:396 start_codon:yes stop_codon:yes gene_type:complete
MSEPNPDTPKNPRYKPHDKVPHVKWVATKRDSVDPEPSHTLEADQWKVDMIHKFGKTKTIFGTTSASIAGLSLVLYPGDQSQEDVIEGLPRITVRHHSYRQAVSKMYFMVVGYVARLNAGEDLSNVAEENE